jgi:SAM-dependent methyltransferase
LGFYRSIIFPRLCDFFLDKPAVARLRRELLVQACGEVLEIGFGTGLNLPFYPEAVRKLTTVDPNAGMHSLARRRMKNSTIKIDQRVLNGERLPFTDGTFDCVVSTFTLCSIAEVDKAMAEVYRVLRPGGKFLFLEHGLGPEPNVQRWQRRLNWLQIRLGDGCHLDRDIRTLVTAQPFTLEGIEQFYLQKFPKTHGYLTRGLGVK